MRIFASGRALAAFAAGVSAGGAAPAFAQEARAASPPETIVVSATRAPLPARAVGASVTVIDREALDLIQTPIVSDILRDAPGVSFSRNGGPGAVTGVRIRGAESDQTAVLIDGVKLNDPSSPGGGYNFANLLGANLERIEVLRGPQSTLYGSQALGGVVAVTTRTGEGPLRLGLDLEAGDLETRQVRASASAGSERLSWAVSGAWFDTAGISALDARQGGREADPFTQAGGAARAMLKLTEALSADARLHYTQSEVGIDGFPAPLFALADTPETSKTDELVAYAGLKLAALEGRLNGTLGLSRTQTTRESLNPPLRVPVTFDASGRNDRLDGQLTFDATPRFQLIGGFEQETARLRTASPSVAVPNPAPLVAESEVSALYLQLQARPADFLTATLGVRRSDNDRFGEALNVRATVAATLFGGAATLRASVGDGFKAPTPFQLFSSFGNASLAPEEAAAWDVGLEGRAFEGRLVGSATWFARDTTNQIDFISCFGSPLAICVNRPFGTYDNIARARAEGVELTAQARPWRGLRIAAGHTELETANRSPGANFGRALPRRPQTTTSVSIGYGWQAGHDLSVSNAEVGDSFDNVSNSRRLAGYGLLAVRAAFQLSPGVQIYGRVENATDEAYQTTFGYGSPPRQAFLGVRFRR